MKSNSTVFRALPFLLCIGVASLVSAADQNGKAALPASAMSKEQAVIAADKYLGFMATVSRPRAATSLATSLEVYGDSLTPFLSHQFSGRYVWKVLISNVFLADGNSQASSRDPRSFEAIVDAVSGQLLRVYSVPQVSDTNLLPEPTDSCATEQLRGKREIWLSIPDSAPAVSFAEALKSAVGCVPEIAEEIIGDCVVMSTPSHPDGIVVWSIIGRGVPPIEITESRDDIPLRYRNRYRTIVDATTGQWLRVTNSPGR
jgi:hypothetical protein